MARTHRAPGTADRTPDAGLRVSARVFVTLRHVPKGRVSVPEVAAQKDQPAASTAEPAAPVSFSGGRLVARRLREHGVGHLFTLSGGHLFSIYDGCRAEGLKLIDVRHE